MLKTTSEADVGRSNRNLVILDDQMAIKIYLDDEQF